MNKLHGSRRKFLKGTAAILAAPAILKYTQAYADKPVIKIGHVSPRTGIYASFAEADEFVLGQIAKAFEAGLENNGKRYKIEIISKDSQSNSNRASQVAADLILRDKVDILVAASTPDTVNPVSDQAEIMGVPCITTDCPWQPYFFGRNGIPGEGFESTYHFFWGLEDVISSFLDMWGQTDVKKTVGALFPNDADGNAWGHPEQGLPKPLKKAGYDLIVPGKFQPLSDDFSSQISAFKEAGCEIITGNMIPPDFATFWSQAAQQGLKPKVVTIGKAILFPSVVESLGKRGDNLSSEVWWSPAHPFHSSLTGESAKELADGYTKTSGRSWTQPIGFKHALFEVVSDVIKRSDDLSDPSAIVKSIASTNLNTIVGKVDWTNGPMNNITKTPLVAGQWQLENDKYDLKIVANSNAPIIPLTGELKLLG